MLLIIVGDEINEVYLKYLKYLKRFEIDERWKKVQFIACMIKSSKSIKFDSIKY